MFTLSEENYLKAIYHLETISEKEISTNAIAVKLNTKASSVTDMVKKLADKETLVYKKYQGVHLTGFGKKIAANIIRKHRLWEVFLVEKLNFSWDEVHEVAEQLEHIKSEKLIDELDAFLEYPKRDPHGDPIPDKDGNLNKLQQVLLADFKENETGICVGVKDSSTAFLQFLDQKNIALGATIKIVHKEIFDDSLSIEIDNKIISISNKIATNLYLKKQ